MFTAIDTVRSYLHETDLTKQSHCLNFSQSLSKFCETVPVPDSYFRR
jgi:hypothetical protein